jgi:tRNA A-37 threonylcarbamoyl transferase component Bud32
MRVRLEKYQRIHGSIRARALALLGCGGIGLFFFSFVGFLGLLMVVVEHATLWEMRSGIALGVFGGLFPFIGSGIMLWRGAVGRRRLLRLRDLAALARSRPSFGSTDVSQDLSLRPLDAERLLLDAASLGLMEEGEPAPPAVPAAPAPGSDFSGVRPAPQALAGASPAPGRRAARGLEPGEVLNGTYGVETVLGSGGMGMVYAARHRRTGRRYAIKTLLPDAQLSPEAIRRFEREATAASALGHPGIVAVHDVHETDEGVHYLVMDLLEGETLEQRLTRVGCLAWPEARRIALEVGSALAAAHDRGLIHRDLKPANIFLARAEGAPERAVLLDFGLAKPLSEEAMARITASGAAVGTPLYMSPEQARGEPLDVRSDVYGLGAVLYEMVTGAPPFLDRTLASVYARLLTESAPAASSAARYPCPSAVDDILSRTLAKVPAGRFDSMRALLSAIEGVPAEGATREGAQRNA